MFQLVPCFFFTALPSGFLRTPRLRRDRLQNISKHPEGLPPSPPSKKTPNHLTWFHNFFHSLVNRSKYFIPFWFLSWSCHSFVSPNLHRLTAVSQTFSLISKILHFYLGKNNFILEIILSWEQFFLENIQVGLNWPNSRNLAQLDAISQNFHSSWIIFASCLFSFWKRWLKSRQTCYLYMGFTSQKQGPMGWLKSFSHFSISDSAFRWVGQPGTLACLDDQNSSDGRGGLGWLPLGLVAWLGSGWLRLT